MQKGGGNSIPEGVDAVLFAVNLEGWWPERPNIEDIANKFGFKVVPILGEGTLQDAIERTRTGFNSQGGVSFRRYRCPASSGPQNTPRCLLHQEDTTARLPQEGSGSE